MAKQKVSVGDIADYLAHHLLSDQIRQSCNSFLKLLRKDVPGFRKPQAFSDEVISFEVAATLHGLKAVTQKKKMFRNLPLLFLRAFYRDLFEHPTVKAVKEYREAVHQRCLLFDQFISLSPDEATLGIGSQFTQLLIQKETSAEHIDFILAAGSHFFARAAHIENFIKTVVRESEMTP